MDKSIEETPLPDITYIHFLAEPLVTGRPNFSKPHAAMARVLAENQFADARSGSDKYM